jgi:hypothetical protein
VGSKGDRCLYGVEGDSERKRSSSGFPTVMDGEIGIAGGWVVSPLWVALS